jgi:CHASE1-domain containing sensor protein
MAIHRTIVPAPQVLLSDQQTFSATMAHRPPREPFVGFSTPLNESRDSVTHEAIGKETSAPHENRQARTNYPRNEPMRPDSLKRREALLKGKEGSRQRRRWENGRYFNKKKTSSK